jgi:hypothetical protein
MTAWRVDIHHDMGQVSQPAPQHILTVYRFSNDTIVTFQRCCRITSMVVYQWYPPEKTFDGMPLLSRDNLIRHTTPQLWIRLLHRRMAL